MICGADIVVVTYYGGVGALTGDWSTVIRGAVIAVVTNCGFGGASAAL